MKSDFNKERRELLKSTCTLVGATALVSIGGSLSAFAASGATAADGATPLQQAPRTGLHKFIIERDIPGAGSFSTEKLQAISQTSCSVLKEMGSQIQWVESYVTDDKIYCVYIAANEELVREHAKRGGFPANRISRVRTIIDPTTAG
jgi:predicted Rdx family selenoprotein